MEEYKLKLSNYDKWLEDERIQWNGIPDWLQRNLNLIEETKKQFPHVVCTEAYEPVIGFASRWCWQNIGPYDGKCYEHNAEDYPGCPLVIATEYINKGSYKDKDGKLIEWEEKAYKDPGEHSHEGNWRYICLDKLGYDYFLGLFLFKEEKYKDKFLVNIETFGIGEKFED